MSHKQLQGGGGAELEEQQGNGEPSYGSPRNPLSPLANQNARPRSPPSALIRVASNGTSSPGVEVIRKPSPKPKKHSPRRKTNGTLISKNISSGGSSSISSSKAEKGKSDRGSGGGAGSVGGQGSSGSIFGLKHPLPSSSDYASNYSMYGDDHLSGNGNGGGSNSGRGNGNSGSGSSLDAAPAHGPRRRGKRVKNKKTTKTKKKPEAAVATARNRSKSTQDRHQSHQNQCQRKQQKQKQQRQQKQQQHYQQPCRVDAGADSDSFATGADNSTVTDMSASMVVDSADIQHFLRTAPEDELKRKAVADAQRRIKVWSEYREAGVERVWRVGGVVELSWVVSCADKWGTSIR
jgi:hypothetical protein